MLSIRSIGIVATLLLVCLASGCEKKPQPMKNLKMEAGPEDARPAEMRNTGKVKPGTASYPAAPPRK